uniref:guanylate cyclase n=1 Tax=Sinocyclocheilus rhinocerous TaxID=307959 RepID=A0A673L6V4_9TELE
MFKCIGKEAPPPGVCKGKLREGGQKSASLVQVRFSLKSGCVGRGLWPTAAQINIPSASKTPRPCLRTLQYFKPNNTIGPRLRQHFPINTMFFLQYGFINTCLKSLVIERFGEETWEKLRLMAGVQETFMAYVITLSLVQEACKMLGEYHFVLCSTNHRMTIYPVSARLFFYPNAFVCLPLALHHLLTNGSSAMNAPFFLVERMDDGRILLHYYSDRKGLYQIVPGIIEAVAKDFFDSEVTMTILNQSEEDERTGKKEHVVFHLVQNEKVTKRKDKEETMKRMKARYASLQLCPRKRSPWEIVRSIVMLGQGLTDIHTTQKDWIEEQAFCNAFTFHIVFDQGLLVKQTGVNIQKFVPGLQTAGIHLDEYFTIVHPEVIFNIQSLKKFINSQFVLKTRREMLPEIHQNQSMLKLRGQMMWMEPLNCMIYLCSPKLRSLQELEKRDLILLNQQRLAEIELSNQRERKKEELRILSRNLEIEKQKSEKLLYAMLPHVANQLKEGKRVEAGEFKVCTILFSDVVTFTNICAACEPIQIVNMLNAMYSRFDCLTNIHNVYKVETVGDAYMVVGGVPVPTDTHAERVANFALSMRIAAREVTNPITRQSIQVCVFKHSVGEATEILELKPNSSLPAHSVLKDKGIFEIAERGEIEVKGKGLMRTYFLLKNLQKSDEQIMGLVDGETCVYQEDLEDVTDKGEETLVKTDKFNFSNSVIDLFDLFTFCAHQDSISTRFCSIL